MYHNIIYYGNNSLETVFESKFTQHSILKTYDTLPTCTNVIIYTYIRKYQNIASGMSIVFAENESAWEMSVAVIMTIT